MLDLAKILRLDLQKIFSYVKSTLMISKLKLKNSGIFIIRHGRKTGVLYQ